MPRAIWFGEERRNMTERRNIGIIRTDDDGSLTDEQIRALKTLTPGEIRTLQRIAEVSLAVQIIIGIMAGISATLAIINFKAILDFFQKAF